MLIYCIYKLLYRITIYYCITIISTRPNKIEIEGLCLLFQKRLSPSLVKR